MRRALLLAAALLWPLATLAQTIIPAPGGGTGGGITGLSGDCSVSGSSGTVPITCSAVGSLTPGPGIFTTVNGWTFNTAAISLTGTTGQTYTLPAATTTLAGLGTAQTLSGVNTITSQLVIGSGGTLRLGSGTPTYLSFTAPTAPTITGGGATVTKSAGNGAAKYTVTGTPSVATITLAMVVATDGYICDGVDVTQGTRLQETTDSSTAPVLTNYTPAGATANFVAADILLVKCVAY